MENSELTVRHFEFREKNLRDFYYILFSHRRLIIVFFIITMVLVAIGTFVFPSIYESEAQLLIKLGRENVALDPTAAVGQTISIGQSREEQINSELQILKSREIAEKVVDTIGVQTLLDGYLTVPADANSAAGKLQRVLQKIVGFPGYLLGMLRTLLKGTNQDEIREGIVQNLMNTLTVEAVKKSNIISLAYDGKDPRLASAVLTKLIDFYLEKHVSVYRTAGSYQFFNEQKQGLHDTLQNTENSLLDLKNNTNIGSLEEQRRILLERIGNIQREIEGSESQKAVTSARIIALRDILSRLPETLVMQEVSGSSGSAFVEMLKKINELSMKEQELLSTFSEQSIQVTEVRRQIIEAKKIMQDAKSSHEVHTGLNQNREKLQLDLLTENALLSSLESKLQTLSKQFTDAQDELKTINKAEVKLTQLERDRGIQDANYRKYSESLEQTRIDQALEMDKISNISILQSPTCPFKPVRPKKLLNLVLGLLISVFGGIGLSFFAEYIDHSFKKPEDIEEQLHLPALTALPCLTADKNGSMRPMEDLPFIIHNDMVDKTNPLYFDIPSALKNQYDVLSDLLLTTVTKENGARILSLTSCNRDEGVSTVAAQLAITMAYHGAGRVLLVDANFHNPCLHQYFHVPFAPGLADMLSDNQTRTGIIHAMTGHNLDLLCAGQWNTAVPSRFFESLEFKNMLNLWKQEYNFVFFDTPPLLEERATISLLNQTDGVILIAEAERTRWEVAQRAKEQLLTSGTNITGVILNKRHYYIPEWLYKTLS